MPSRPLLSLLQVLAFLFSSVVTSSFVEAQSAKQSSSPNQISEKRERDNSGSLDSDHVKLRDAWFARGRLIPGKSTAELRRRAYTAKLQMRAQRAADMAAARVDGKPPVTSAPWQMLGPVPLASDATGNGTQNYNQVSGRATAVVIDPADPTGNTVYIGGAQGGIWKSTNAAASAANSVAWTATADDQATLAIGALAIQPGNTNPANSVILAATGEADNSSDSYFGLGILRSTNAGGSWALISTANSGALSFAGLGGTRMAFDTASGQTNTVVAAMGISSEGLVDAAVTANTTPGLYTSQDAGQAWTYKALTDPGGPTDATSATSVVFNGSAGLFFAAVRYHGFYSSPDGVTWTRLATQPSGTLTTTACPPQSSSNNYACPIYRAELTVVPGRNEMYAWIVSLDSTGNPIDGGIWQSLTGGVSWNQISETTVTNCGDIEGCGVDQGTFNLELLAVPDGSGTDLYAGAVNLYKCQITTQNPTCAVNPFMNLTHVYGCDPIAAPSHVHPDQHGLAYVITAAGTDLMYFANDGGIYRALDGFSGLTTGSCTGTNAFDDLNQNLGPMTEFVSFSNHPTDPNTLLGGTQDNGSPGTSTATTNSTWGNILGGDGGYNAIDPNTPANFYASNPDVPPGGLGVQLCPDGVACNDSTFSFVVTSSALAGDDGAFYFPYILDPQSATAMIIGTCRIWRGPRIGGTFTALSSSFDTQGADPCSGSEVNLVDAVAAGGRTDSNGSMVVYATTSGLGPINGPLSTPPGGHVWVTTNATALTFTDVTNNGPQGSINPNEFPVSAVALDTSDLTGGTAYVTVMGFTGGSGHVWQTTDFGANWVDFTANLPDSPVNAVVIDPVNEQIYVGTDVGVFVSSTASANWTELGPNPDTNQSGFLPNVPITALSLFSSGGEELLRASTYGRGVWQSPINAVGDYQLAISNTPQTAFPNQTAVFSGTAASINGYESSVTLSCVAGATPPPSSCIISPSTITPSSTASFSVDASGATGMYNFNVQGVGSDSNHTTNLVLLSLNVVSFALSRPTPSNVTVPRGTASPLVDFQVTAAGSFNQSVTVSCTLTNPLPGATCALTPSTTVNPTVSNPVNMTASVTVPSTTPTGTYQVTIQATSSGVPAAITTSFTITVTTNPGFALSEPTGFPEVNAGSTGTSGPISITSQDGFDSTVTLSCPTTYGAGSCSVSPTTVNSYPATANLTINGSSFAAGSYSLSVTGTSGSDMHSVTVPFNVGDYSISGTQSLSLNPGGQGTANLTLTSSYFYSGKINATCDASALSGAQCTLAPGNPIAVTADGSTSLAVIVNVPTNAADGNYNINISTQDTTGAPSHSFTLALNVAENFIVYSATPVQMVLPGQTTGAYSLAIEPVGNIFNAPVTLSCSGLPAGAQCQFNPSTPVTPGTSAVDVVLNISTSSNINLQRDMRRHAALYAAELFVPGVIILCASGRCARKRASRQIAFLAMLALLASALLSCAGVSSGGGGGGGNCSSVPGVPAEPESSSPTITGNGMVSTTLTWPATNTDPACTESYTLYENGSPLSGPPLASPTYGAQLSPGTYSFTVAAQDSGGTSAQSPALDLGVSAITITGTSGSLTNQTTVFLVLSSNPVP